MTFTGVTPAASGGSQSVQQWVNESNLAQARPSTRWTGWVVLLSSLGVALFAAADVTSRAGSPLGDALFWAGLLLLVAPIGARLLGRSAQRNERIGLTVTLGVALYLVRVMAYPLDLILVDEAPHVRNTANILATGRLFNPVPFLDIAAWFPGMETVAAALTLLSGWPLSVSALIVVGAARLLLMLSLFLFFEQLVRSSRIAGIAVMIYAANPLFLFFDAQFAYESLGIALAALALFAISKHYRIWRGGRRALTRVQGVVSARIGYFLVACAALCGVTVTHHVTAYVVSLLLTAWAVVAWYETRRRTRTAASPILMGRFPAPVVYAGISLALSVAWMVVTQGRVISYLVALPVQMVQEVVAQFSSRQGRALFQDGSGTPVPRWELLVAFATVVLLLSALALGAFTIWQRYRSNTWILAFVGASLAYPLTLAMRLTPAGGTAGNRLTGFTFLPLALVVAIAVTRAPRHIPRRPHLLTRALAHIQWHAYAMTERPGVRAMGIPAFVLCASIIFVGGAVTGSPQAWNRLPGPYLVDADQRGATAQGLDAALWMNQHLSPNSIVATDLSNREFILGYTDLKTVNNLNAGIYPLFASPYFGGDQIQIIRTDQIDYLVVDQRLSAGLSHDGSYFGDWLESEETVPGVNTNAPIPLTSLRKFQSAPQMNRIYDNGVIAVYATGAIAHAP